MDVTKKEIQRGYDEIAGIVGLSPKFYRAVLRLADRCEGRVLDIGCGRGLLLEHIRKRFSGVTLFGCDISEALVRQTRERNPGARVTLGDAEQLPFAAGSFDQVFLTEVLEHLLDYGAGLHEIHRILAPGGSFVVSVPNRDWISYEVYLETRKEFQPVDDHWFRVDELKELVTGAGFRIEQIGGADSLGRKKGLPRLLEKIRLFLDPKLSLKQKRLVLQARKPKED